MFKTQICAITLHVASCERWKCDGELRGNTLPPLTTRYMTSYGTKLCPKHYTIYKPSNFFPAGKNPHKGELLEA